MNVAGITQLSTRARAVSDAGMGELGRQLACRAGWYGLDLVVVDRWYASSRTCHHCQGINTSLTLADRSWVCTTCGTVHDRDVNAAVNLACWPAQLAVQDPPLPAAA